MSDGVVTEYVELCEQIAAEALFAEEVEQRLYDRLDQLWYAEMSAADREEAAGRLVAKASAWQKSGRASGKESS